MAGRKSKRIKPLGDDQGARGHNDFMPDNLDADYDHDSGYDSGTEEEQEEFNQDVKVFHMERGMAFKPPKFYREEINLLKLWKVVMNLGGYEQVTSCKLWRNVGELFNPPKTCTTLAFAFRGLYQKSLLEYENHKTLSNEVPDVGGSHKGNSKVPTKYRDSQVSSRSGRPPRNSAIRAKQVWQSLKISSSHNDEDDDVEELFVANKNKETGITLMRPQKSEKELKLTSSAGLPKLPMEPQLPLCNSKDEKITKNLSGIQTTETNFKVHDIGPPANWVKISVFTTTDGYEVFALIPGLSQDDVQIQYDPAGHLVILGQPENPDDNPWGLFPFRKVIEFPTRVNPHKTTAVVTLHGQLFIRAPFEQSNA